MDRTFNCNPKRAKEIVKYISALKDCETNFHFEVGADLFDDEFIELFRERAYDLFELKVMED